MDKFTTTTRSKVSIVRGVVVCYPYRGLKSKYGTLKSNPNNNQMNVTINDIAEVKMFSKREIFMQIFFEVHNSQPHDSVPSIVSSYYKAELEFIKRYQAKAYKSDESFLRTYYYYLNSKVKTSTVEGCIITI